MSKTICHCEDFKDEAAGMACATISNVSNVGDCRAPKKLKWVAASSAAWGWFKRELAIPILKRIRMRLPPIVPGNYVSFVYILKIRFGAHNDALINRSSSYERK